MGDTPTSPGKDFALATLSWFSPIRRPRLWQTLIGAILSPCRAGTPKSEHLPSGRFRLTAFAVASLEVYRPHPCLPWIPAFAGTGFGLAWNT